MSRVRKGELAPSFNALALEGRNIRIEDYRGRKVWLSFYRYARCPLCNLYMHFVLSKMAFLNERGVHVIAVFESKPEKFPKYIGGMPSASVNLIPDPEHQLYKAYAVERSWKAMLHPRTWVRWMKAQARGFFQHVPDTDMRRLPAHFLIDEKGVIQQAYYCRHAGDEIPWSMVLEFAGAAPKLNIDESVA